MSPGTSSPLVLVYLGCSTFVQPFLRLPFLESLSALKCCSVSVRIKMRRSHSYCDFTFALDAAPRDATNTPSGREISLNQPGQMV